MICIQSPAELELLRGNHMQLADMAGHETIRQMHIDLATWHHEQLIRMVLG